MPRLLLVSGSRDLAASAESADWAKVHIAASVGEADLVLSGAAVGPDSWARESALASGKRIIEYALDGFRWVDGVKTEARWHGRDDLDNDTYTRRWPLHRNDMLIEACKKSLASKWDVRGLFLRSFTSKTHGTKYTLDRAGSAGVRCDDQRWGWPAVDAVPAMEFSEGPQVVVPEAELEPLPIVWTDFETGGFVAGIHALTEIASVVTDFTGRERIGEPFHRVVLPHPTTIMSAQAIEITGYSPERWASRGAVHERHAMRDWHAWLPKRFYWGGYHGAFDRRHARAALARHLLSVPQWIENDDRFDACKRAKATLKRSGLIESASLGAVCAYLGIDIGTAHSAVHDILATAAVHVKLEEREGR